MRAQYKLGYLLLLALFCCKKPYDPPAISSPNSYLVVEGQVISGNDSTIIKLSRTVNLSASTTLNPEMNAVVSIISNTNASYSLTEMSNGQYAVANLNLSGSDTYRLKIVTADKRVYQSDFLPVKSSPPIDSISYLIKTNGVQIVANTHDPQNNTRYYRWDYMETYETHAAYSTDLIYSDIPKDTVYLQTAGQQNYFCWKSDTSSTIVLGTSAKLVNDLIADQPITFLSSTSAKISDLYSILVKQYALTAAAYNYWQLLATNTQQLGTIFDAQPSELPSNIHCTSNPSEPVIGYLSVGSVSQQRIYVDSRKLPSWPVTEPSADECTPISVYYHDPKTGADDVIAELGSGEYIPYGLIGMPHAIGYIAIPAPCGDCTLSGGKNMPPAFWSPP
jgi:hypothetical protein